MAEKLGLAPGVKELKLGPSFTNKKSSKAFHTLRYDFKPASVDESKMATVDVGANNTMSVTVPSLNGAGVPHTVFKGSQKPYSKECVLIIDKVTGEITLERLSSNIQVKKTRSGTKTQQNLSVHSTTSANRPITPEAHKSPNDSHFRDKKNITKSHQVPSKHKSNNSKSSPVKPSQASKTNKNKDIVAHNSLPMIGCDDFPPKDVSSSKNSLDKKKSKVKTKEEVLSESSSSSSDSSGSSSDSEDDRPVPAAHISDTKSSTELNPAHFLNEDLQLSESESDSD